MVVNSTRLSAGGRPPAVAASRTAISVLALACCIGLNGLAPASAETIRDALAAAYRWNPKLDAARATMRATDEQVSIANSGYRPTVAATGNAGILDTSSVGTDGSRRPTIESHPRGYGLTATQTLFKGGQVVNTVRAAEAQVRAARETLRGVEQQVLLDSATSYLDVIRDQAIVKLRQNNVRILTEDRKQTRERFNVGEVTRTDVAQSEATLAAAVSALDLAKSNLETSRASYERNIGNAPSSLIEPRPVDSLLPRTLNDAISNSARENPNVVAALYSEQQQRHTIDQIYGQLLPSAQLQASYNRAYEPSGASTTAQADTKSLVASVTVPLYTGGLVDAQVRQAKQVHISRIQQIEQARTETKQTVVAAWSQLIAARAQLVSDNTQVSSAQIALTGVREEERVGQRTLLDVLNAEQTLLNAQVSVVTDKHNIGVAAYAVLSSAGRLNISELGGVETIYDAEQHYHEVRRQWWGVSITRADGRVETHDFWETHGRKTYDEDEAKRWKPVK